MRGVPWLGVLAFCLLSVPVLALNDTETVVGAGVVGDPVPSLVESLPAAEQPSEEPASELVEEPASLQAVPVPIELDVLPASETAAGPASQEVVASVPESLPFEVPAVDLRDVSIEPAPSVPYCTSSACLASALAVARPALSGKVVYQLERDPDFPCYLEYDGVIACPEVSSDGLVALAAMHDLSGGVPVVDYRQPLWDVSGSRATFNGFARSSVPLHDSSSLRLDLSREGVFVVGFASNVFYVTSFPGACTNCTVDGGVALANTHASSDSAIRLWLQFTGDGTDGSGYGNTGTLAGNVFINYSWADGFDGVTTSRVTVDDHASMDVTDLTLSFWVKVNTLLDSQLAVQQVTTGVSSGWFCTMRNATTTGFRCTLRNGTDNSVDTGGVSGDQSPDLALNTWYHVVLTYNSTSDNASIYLDGALKHSKIIPNVNLTGNDNLKIGAGSNNPLNGSIDEIILYNRSLSASEVSSLYGTGLYLSSGRYNDSARDLGSTQVFENLWWNATGNTVSFQARSGDNTTWSSWSSVSTNGGSLSLPDARYVQASAVLSTSSTKTTPVLYSYWVNSSDAAVCSGDPAVDASGNGYALSVSGASNSGSFYSFDGVNDWANSSVNANQTLRNGAFTLSLWVKSDLDMNDKYFFAFDDGGGDRFYLRQNTVSGQVLVGLSNWNQAYTGGAVGGWTHYVLSYNGSHGLLYRNNALLGSSIVTPNYPSSTLYLAASKTPSNYFNGSLDDVRLWNRTLNSTERASVYNNDSVTNGLVIAYPFESSCETRNYDNNGNLIQDDDYYYEYNNFNQLLRVRSGSVSGYVMADYVYDESGKRIKKTEYNSGGSVTKKTYYIGDEFVREVNASGSNNDTIYVYAGSQLVAQQNAGVKQFFHPNHLGSTDITTNSSGGLVETSKTEPYGRTISGGSGRYVFTGQERDKEIELDYFDARYYDYGRGQFTSADSILPDVYDPQGLNRYAYVRNNPLKYTDPTGHWAFNIQLGAGGGAGPAAGTASLNFGFSYSGDEGLQFGFYGSEATGWSYLGSGEGYGGVTLTPKAKSWDDLLGKSVIKGISGAYGHGLSLDETTSDSDPSVVSYSLSYSPGLSLEIHKFNAEASGGHFTIFHPREVQYSFDEGSKSVTRLSGEGGSSSSKSTIKLKYDTFGNVKGGNLGNIKFSSGFAKKVAEIANKKK